MGSCRPGRGFHSSLPDACRSQPALPLAWGKGLAARRLCRPARRLLFPCKAARKARGIHKGRRAMPRASLFMRCRNGFSMRPGNGRFSSLAKACPLSEGCCQQPALSLAWGKGLAARRLCRPARRLLFPCKAARKARGIHKGRRAMPRASLFMRCRNGFSMRPGNGRFSSLAKACPFSGTCCCSPLCPLSGIKASPRGAPASPPGGFL